MDTDWRAQLARIADEMDNVRESRNAEIGYDLLADAITWSDEYPSQPTRPMAEFQCLRLVLRHRTTLLLEEPDDTFKEYWDRARELFPNWAGFAPSRLLPSDELREFYRRRSKHAMRCLDRIVRRESGLPPSGRRDPSNDDSQKGTPPRTCPMQAHPKPITSLVIVSLAVILASLGLTSLSAAMVVNWWDPGTVIVGLLLLSFSIILAMEQYRGTFRRVRNAAELTSAMLFLVGGAGALAFISTLCEFVLAGTGGSGIGLLRPMAPILLSMLAVAASTLPPAWLNLRWARSLPKPTTDRPRLQFTLRELLGFMTAIAVVVGLTAAQIHPPPPKYAEHVAPADAPISLPEDATDVSYCRGFRGSIAYEFTTTEANFRQWVDSGIGSVESQAADLPIVPIVKPVSIRRYNVYSADLTGPDSVTVTAGLDYSWRYEDRSVHAVFDSTTNRAYYAANYH